MVKELTIRTKIEIPTIPLSFKENGSLYPSLDFVAPTADFLYSKKTKAKDLQFKVHSKFCFVTITDDVVYMAEGYKKDKTNWYQLVLKDPEKELEPFIVSCFLYRIHKTNLYSINLQWQRTFSDSGKSFCLRKRPSTNNRELSKQQMNQITDVMRQVFGL